MSIVDLRCSFPRHGRQPLRHIQHLSMWAFQQRRLEVGAINNAIIPRERAQIALQDLSLRGRIAQPHQQEEIVSQLGRAQAAKSLTLQKWTFNKACVSLDAKYRIALRTTLSHASAIMRLLGQEFSSVTPADILSLPIFNAPGKFVR
jgi:hypothetical protein